MKICQIAIVGENIEWILKGLISFRANKLILISTSDPEFVKKINDIKDRLSDPKFELKLIEIEELLIESKDLLEFVKIFKNTVLENFEQQYQIEINATAGLRVWQILSYFIKIQLKDIVRNYFIINKQTGEPIIFPPSILSKTEQMILDTIGMEKRSIEQIKQSYETLKGRTVTPALISKYLIKLKEKELVYESKIQKLKYFKLTDLGKIYQIDSKIYSLM